MSTTRKVTIISTRGANKTVINSEAKTWGELIPEIEAELDINVSQMLITEAKSRHDLVNTLAVLPEEDFRIIIRPKDTKAGADMTYRELRKAISQIFLSDGEKARNFFGNYTIKTTKELQELFNAYTQVEDKDTSAKMEELPKKELIDVALSALARLKETSEYNQYLEDAIENVLDFRDDIVGGVSVTSDEEVNDSEKEEVFEENLDEEEEEDLDEILAGY